MIKIGLFITILIFQVQRGQEYIENGKIDWVKGVITAKGYGAFDPNAKNVSQEILKAIRVATVVAQRNLLEVIKGVHITSETIVEDYLLKSDFIVARVQGVVKNARMNGEPKIDRENGIVEVELMVDFYGENGVLTPVLTELAQKIEKRPAEEVAVKTPQYTGVIFDASGTDVSPAVLPKIYDEKGNLIFDTSELVDPKNPNAQKVINFVSNLNDLLSDPEVSKLPLVIKIKSAINKRDFVIDKDEADKLKWIKALYKVGKKLILTLF
ncbi:MAG: hypothetical protein ABDH37_05225 [Candidatus Hydrothermales bacterium]